MQILQLGVNRGPNPPQRAAGAPPARREAAASPRPGPGAPHGPAAGRGQARGRAQADPGGRSRGRGGLGADRGGLRALFVPCDGGRSRGCSLPAARPATGAARRGPGSRLRRDPARPLPWGGLRTVGAGDGGGGVFLPWGWRPPGCRGLFHASFPSFPFPSLAAGRCSPLPGQRGLRGTGASFPKDKIRIKKKKKRASAGLKPGFVTRRCSRGWRW